jgi:hypothetical protein
MEEVQEEAGILGHAARDIDERHERRVAGRGRAIGEIDDRPPARSERRKGSARVDAAAVGIGGEAAGHALVVGQAQIRDERFALAISSADICAKSLPFSTSRSETVRRAEKLGLLLGRLGSGGCGAMASATRKAPAFGFSSVS